MMQQQQQATPVVAVAAAAPQTIIVQNNTNQVPVNHCCHCILTVVTMGAWAPFWLLGCCGICCERPCGC